MIKPQHGGLSVVISYGLSCTKFNCSNGTDFYKIAAKCVSSTEVLIEVTSMPDNPKRLHIFFALAISL